LGHGTGNQPVKTPACLNNSQKNSFLATWPNLEQLNRPEEAETADRTALFGIAFVSLRIEILICKFWRLGVWRVW